MEQAVFVGVRLRLDEQVAVSVLVGPVAFAADAELTRGVYRCTDAGAGVLRGGQPRLEAVVVIGEQRRHIDVRQAGVL